MAKKRKSIKNEDEFEVFKKKVVSFFSKTFPQHELLIRSDGKISHIKISKPVQVFGIILLSISVGWAIFSSFSYFIHDQIVLSRDKEILEARMAYRGLLSEVKKYQTKFADLTQELGKNNRLMLDLVEKNATLQRDVKSAVIKLKTTKSRNKKIVVSKANLHEKLAQIEMELEALNNHNFSLKGNLSSVTTDLESALFERNEARSESEKLSKMVKDLRDHVADLSKSKIKIIKELRMTLTNNIEDILYALKFTKLDLKNFTELRNANEYSGRGGPFIPAESSKDISSELRFELNSLDFDLKQFRKLQVLMRQLPLSAPLNYFTISSHFGKRRDPINKRWAIHTGLDFGGIKNSSVYTTASGKVTFAGRNGKYGKLVEIDHGFGFKTKYGHLNKVLVKRGQKVEYRARIGLMGSTGRSTGPHLHYEILFKGRHQNPIRFIKAGRYVYKR